MLLDIHRKYKEKFCAIVSAPVGTFAERLIDTSCQDFSLLSISLAMVKTDVKNAFFYSQLRINRI